MLAAKGQLGDGLQEMTVELYLQMTAPKAHTLFSEINKVQPVKIVDLQTSEGGASSTEKVILGGAVEALRTQFRPMFKPSVNCRAPHVHIDTLR